MIDWQAEFSALLREQLIPDWCAEPLRQSDPTGFKWESVRLAECDARDFLKAWHAGLVQPERAGLYRAHRSAALEQFFWNGPRFPVPRSYTLWFEPVITFAALARLHFNFGWPVDLMGTQSNDWAFDIVCFPPDGQTERVAGEVKKSVAEIDVLVELMIQFGQDSRAPLPASGKTRNAFKKVEALKARRAPIFWALGPANYGKVFRVIYEVDTVRFEPTNDHVLRFSHLRD